MNPFTYSHANGPEAAVAAVAKNPHAAFVAGGTTLVDLLRLNVMAPDALVDVNTLPLAGIETLPGGGVRIGALVRNSDLAHHATIRKRYPVLSEALLSGASPQLRNMATVGGNLMQRTRCYYFYDGAAHCNKRTPGAGCDAVDGFNRIHAILGASSACVATHPSDMCVALAALDAIVHVEGPNGSRSLNFVNFHRLPGDRPDVETELAGADLVTAIELPPLSFGGRSTYRKVRDRASYAFALVSVAAAIDVANGKVSDVRLALGGVAHKPWRAFEAEKVLRGRPATIENFGAAAEAELSKARGLKHNTFKIELARRVIVHTLSKLSQGGQS
jgi:xanthine dehydrogenase YagS FAD-binding subunit